jgi:hypothetical protein
MWNHGLKWRPGSLWPTKALSSRIGRNARRGTCFSVAAQKHATIWPSASKAPSSAHAEAEDRKLRKDPSGGPCFEGTLQKPTGVSESSPVAGTIENSTFSESLDAGRTREIQTNYDPAATLLLSVNCLYQMNEKNCKGEFEKCVSLPIWFGDRAAG